MAHHPTPMAGAERAEFLDPTPPAPTSEVYSQAVRVGDRVLLSGQGGWVPGGSIPDVLEAEVTQAFDNVAGVLAAANVTWADVRHAASFYVGDAVPELAARELRRRGARADIRWRDEPVPMLGAQMHIEIKVSAGAEPADDRITHTTIHSGERAAGQVPATEEQEIAQAFTNLESELRAMGATWEQVIGLDSWHRHLDLEVFTIISDLSRLIPHHRPIWTCVGANPTDPRVAHLIQASVLHSPTSEQAP